MTTVFVSHSSEDALFIEQEIRPLLNARTFVVWLSGESIQTAEQWERAIKRGLEASDWFIVALSPRSTKSEWVRTETHWAFENRKGRIVPILIETCKPEDIHLGLIQLQHVDFCGDRQKAAACLLKVFETADSAAASGSSLCPELVGAPCPDNNVCADRPAVPVGPSYDWEGPMHLRILRHVHSRGSEITYDYDEMGKRLDSVAPFALSDEDYVGWIEALGREGDLECEENHQNPSARKYIWRISKQGELNLQEFAPPISSGAESEQQAMKTYLASVASQLHELENDVWDCDYDPDSDPGMDGRDDLDRLKESYSNLVAEYKAKFGDSFDPYRELFREDCESNGEADATQQGAHRMMPPQYVGPRTGLFKRIWESLARGHRY